MAAVAAPLTLSDLLPRTNDRTKSGIRTALLVLGAALLTAAAAQFSITLPFTPVPITGQTFAVMLTGAALGWRKGAAGQLLYVALGLVFPFYADGAHGWKVVSGSSGGYLVGFVFAAALIGYLAERRQDRNFLTSVPAMLAGSAIIYVFGVAWLCYKLKLPLFNGSAAIKANPKVAGVDGVSWGLAPFIIGDLFKLSLAGALTPIAWKLSRKG
jgi:biotin transport system substrate-specific component